jgi:hypothetical protein
MRIIPDKLIIDSSHTGHRYNRVFADGVQSTYDNSIEITDDGWDKIVLEYERLIALEVLNAEKEGRLIRPPKRFAVVLRELISLAGTVK